MAVQYPGFGEAIDTDTVHIVPMAPPEDYIGDQPEFPDVVTAGLTEEESELLWRVRAAIDRYEPIRASRSHIHITMRDGAVVLEGRARSVPMKIIAERLAASAADGRPVVSEIMADPDVAIAAASALAADPRTNMTNFLLVCMGGVVRLWGPAPSAAAAQAAAEIVRGVPGVAHVVNDLVVGTPGPSEAQAKVDAGATSEPSPTVTPPPRPAMPST